MHMRGEGGKHSSTGFLWSRRRSACESTLKVATFWRRPWVWAASSSLSTGASLASVIAENSSLRARPVSTEPVPHTGNPAALEFSRAQVHTWKDGAVLEGGKGNEERVVWQAERSPFGRVEQHAVAVSSSCGAWLYSGTHAQDLWVRHYVNY